MILHAKHLTCTPGNMTIIPTLVGICREAPRPSFVAFGVGLSVSAVGAVLIRYSHYCAVVFVWLWQKNETISYVRHVNLEKMKSEHQGARLLTSVSFNASLRDFN